MHAVLLPLHLTTGVITEGKQLHHQTHTLVQLSAWKYRALALIRS